MNIDDATRLYKEFGQSLNPDFESLAGMFRQLSIEAPLSNSNYLHALSLTDLLFKHTDTSLSMVTGGTGDGFIGTLKGSFCAMLKRIKARKGKARVIVLDGETKLLREWEQGEFAGTLEIAVATVRPNAEVRHFIVGDDDMVRDEEPHDALTGASDANKVRANVYFKNKAIARVFSSRFEAMWDAVK